MTTDPKPEMSRHEASWHEHLAGMRAAQAARRQAGDPQATDAMATATAGAVEIAGYRLHPAGQGTLWTLQRLAREFAAWANGIGMPVAAPNAPDGSREQIELGLTILTFIDSLRIWHELEAGKLPDLVLEAERLIHTVPLDAYRKLEAHFHREMQRIRDLTPDPASEEKKSPTGIPAGDSPAMPTRPTATPSPTSNG